MRLYWTIRHAIWDWREHLTVKAIDLHMAGNETLFVHVLPGARAKYAITRVSEGQIHREPHSHIEAPRKPRPINHIAQWVISRYGEFIPTPWLKRASDWDWR